VKKKQTMKKATTTKKSMSRAKERKGGDSTSGQTAGTSLRGIARTRTRKPSAPSILSSVSAIRRYADSFVGLTIEEAKSRFSRAKKRMTKWEQGKLLVVTFPRYEVLLLFYGDEVLTASVQVLSE
jgi:hypothetical protein